MDTDTPKLPFEPEPGSFIAGVYDELRETARNYLGGHAEPGADSLQPTGLVHEVFLRLADRRGDDFKSRTHLLAAAALAMRHVLIDKARARMAGKRGGEWQRITLTNSLAVAPRDQVDLLELHEALNRLAKLDERAARVVEMRFFGGMTEAEVANALGVSDRTVRTDWTMARAWLRCELDGSDENKS